MDDLIHWAMPKLESRTEIEVNCAPVHIVKFKKLKSWKVHWTLADVVLHLFARMINFSAMPLL